MKIVTHNGHFHADELLGVATLLLRYPEAEVIRSRDPEVIKTGDIVLDVGQEYDPSLKRFDHHQPGGAGKRDNGIPYASFGLIWKEYGEGLAGGPEEANLFDETVVMPVDAVDNAIVFSHAVIPGLKEYSLGDFFESFATGHDSSGGAEQAFFEALPIARDLIKREILIAQNAIRERREVLKLYESSNDKRIIILPIHMRWKKVLAPTEAYFVTYPRTGGSWGAQAVPKVYGTFEVKKRFPQSWSGLTGAQLAQASGVQDAIFCHKDCHLAGAQSKEGAIKLAEIALRENNQ